MPKPEATAPFHSVHDALRTLDVVARHSGGVTASQIAREACLPRAHLTALLAMLHSEGYVERITDDGGAEAYVAGAALARLGAGLAGAAALRARLRDSLARLRDSVGAAVYISRYTDGEVEVVDMAEGPEAPAVEEWVDFRSSAHASAIGKCLLTQLDLNGRRDHLARHRVARLTSHTITNERLLLSRLAGQPATVPVLDLQEYAAGTVCAAVPLTAGAATGCVALSLPVSQAHRLRAAAASLNRGAAPLALTLTLSGAA